MSVKEISKLPVCLSCKQEIIAGQLFRCSLKHGKVSTATHMGGCPSKK